MQRLVFFGSSCIYPRDCAQPIRESYLLGGPLEPTNEAYSIAKIAGLKLCEAYNRQYGTRYVSLMPTNLYGPNDNYDPTNSHVLPALIRKAHDAVSDRADTLTVWGTGAPRREFLHVDDLAGATLFLLQQDPDGGVFNVGTGKDIPIRALAAMVCRIAGFPGELVFDTTKRTARRASCSTYRASPEWGGSQRSGWRRASPALIANSPSRGTARTPPWHERAPPRLRGIRAAGAKREKGKKYATRGVVVMSGSVTIFHNVVWSRHKGQVFSALHRLHGQGPIAYHIVQTPRPST